MNLKYAISIFLIVVMSGNAALAQNFVLRSEFPSSPNPVGSGARALAMGGAFIAIADDATAASWNPGGLVQLERAEISFVGDFFHRTDDNSFGIESASDGEQTVSEFGVNYLSAAYPFVFLGRNMVVSMNHQKRYDFNREWHFSLSPDSDGFSANQNFDYQQAGNLSALGIAYCIQITPRFSAGFTLNVWDDDLGKNEWEQKISQEDTGTDNGEAFTRKSRNLHRYTFSGVNANFGVLWNATDQFTVGAVLKTPFKADLKHEHTFYHSIRFPELPPEYATASSKAIHTDETLEMPLSYGIGLAYKFSKTFTASLDIYRTEWDDFVQTDADGREFSPITGGSPEDIDPTHPVRMGFEYLFITPKYILPLCAGVFYDPAPARGDTDDFFGFSIGSGIGWKQIHFDFAYQYRFGNTVGSSVLENWDFSQDVTEHTVYSSVIVHF